MPWLWLFSEFGTELKRNLGPAESFQHLFPGHATQSEPAPEISVSLALTASEWADVLNAEDEPIPGLEAAEVVLSKRLVVADDVVSWETGQVEIGSIKVITNGEIVKEELSLSVDDEGDPLETFSLLEVLRRLAILLKSSIQVIHTTDNPRSWSDRFAARPTIIDNEHVQQLWTLSQSTGNRRRPWTRVTQKYQEVAPNDQRPAGVASSIQIEERDLTVPVGMTGEGSQAMLRLIDQLERGSKIMVIEEPETHLHPALIKQVGELLSVAAQSGKQIFICTHSPFLVEQSALENFFIVKKNNNRTEVSATRSIDKLRDLLYDLGMRPSDVLFSDAILLVEGLSDELFFNSISRTIGVPLAGRHVKIVRANGYPRGRHKIEFWAEVGVDAGIPLLCSPR